MRRDRYGEDLGTVSIETADTRITVGRKYRMDVTYTAGPRGVAVGGSVRFKLPGFRVLDFPRGAPVTCSDEGVRLECANALPAVDGKAGVEFFTIDYLFVTVREKDLAPGEAITVTYGRGIQEKYTGAFDLAHRWPVEAAVDPDGTRPAPSSGFWLVPGAPVLEFVADRAAKLEVTIPSSTVAGEPFAATARARDKYMNLADGYSGTVELRVGGVVVAGHSFTADDAGVHRFEGITLAAPGIHRVDAFDAGGGHWARSNATRVHTEPPPYRVRWGDTHIHSRISADTAAWNELISSPAEDYAYARDRSGLDFAAVTDHSEDMSAADWAETRAAAAAANEPGRFVSFTAIESTHRPMRGEGGDKNLYWFADDQPFTGVGGVAETYAFLKALPCRTMSIQHIHAGADWSRHDPELERVVEVYAHWGNGMSVDAEPPMLGGVKPDCTVHDALERGLKVGFIASADHSKGRPGDDFFWPLGPYQGGLAAVYATELTRAGVWDALWQRRCYGTTRARILVEFAIDGTPMGSELPAAGERRIACGVYGTAAIETVEIVKNGRVWRSFTGEGVLDVEREFVDDALERATDWYYLHAVQVDGEQAWASPVWVG